MDSYADHPDIFFIAPKDTCYLSLAFKFWVWLCAELTLAPAETGTRPPQAQN